MLTVREEAWCQPWQAGFYLWRNEGRGDFSDPRSATAFGLTIKTWVFKQDDRSRFPRILIEAETYAGVSPELDEEIWQIVDSIWFYGG